MNVEKLEFIRDLIYYDGPLLSLFELEDIKYLVSWIDLDNINNYYLLFEISNNDLSSLLDNKLLLIDLYTNNKIYYKVIFNFEKEHLEIIEQLERKEILEEYLPSNDSYLY
jgi:hypothetical protein